MRCIRTLGCIYSSHLSVSSLRPRGGTLSSSSCTARPPQSQPPMMPTDGPPQPIHIAKDAIDSLAAIVGGAIPSSVASSEDPAAALLHDTEVARTVTDRLRAPGTIASAGGSTRRSGPACPSSSSRCCASLLRWRWRVCTCAASCPGSSYWLGSRPCSSCCTRTPRRWRG
jgi:hypothetical protein